MAERKVVPASSFDVSIKVVYAKLTDALITTYSKK